jgi:hypothetical protein
MNYRTYLTTFVMLTILPISVFAEEHDAHEPGAHVHGVATLQMAVDAKTLTLNFSSPLDNLIGFEHKSHNQAEVQQVQNMINQFYKTSLFVPTIAAQCKLQSIHLESLVIKKNPTESANVNKPQHEEPAGHADLDAELVYQCNEAKSLRDLQVNMFNTFPNLHQLNVEVVSSQGQTAAKLTPASNQVTW